MKNKMIFLPLLVIVVSIGTIIKYNLQDIVEAWMRFSLRDERIVVSLTTTPHRIDHIQLTLNSLLAQNVKIDNIYLAIPNKFKRDNLSYKIPQWLIDMPRVTILRTKDYGPATKLLGSLAAVNLEVKTIIVTVDDDTVYPQNVILQLAYYAHQHPNAAVGLIGANPIYDEHGMIAADSARGLERFSRKNSTASLLQGWAGIAYRVEFFDNSIFAIEESIPECINSDDIYLSFHLAKKKIPRLVLRNKYINGWMLGKDTNIANSGDALYKLNPTPVEKHRACVAYLHDNNKDVMF